jgi:hypothetical protein
MINNTHCDRRLCTEVTRYRLYYDEIINYFKFKRKVILSRGSFSNILSTLEQDINYHLNISSLNFFALNTCCYTQICFVT